MASNIATPHPTYAERADDWDLCSIAYEGQTAVKAEGVRLLPRLTGMDDETYAAYKLRAMYYAVFSRTVKGLSGALTFKRPDLTNLTDEFEESLKHVGSRGEALSVFTTKVSNAFLKYGRSAILVDSNELGDPHLALYEALNVINWRTERVGTKDMLTMVVLRERIEVADENDRFALKRSYQYRLLELVPDGEGGRVYQYSVWRNPTDKPDENVQDHEFVLHDEGTPTYKNGQTLDHIPIYIVDSEGTGETASKPFLLDMVHVSLSHYLNSADLEWGRHFTALPTAWASGFDPEQTFRVGSAVAWITDNLGAKAAYLEFTGAGLGHLAEGMKDKEKQMAVLGARLLEEAPRQAESEGAAALRQSGEHSTLVGIGQEVSSALTDALREMARWRSRQQDEGVTYKLITDFNFRTLSSDELATMMLAVQSGLMGYDTFFKNLKRGGIIPDGTSKEEELADIETGGFALVNDQNSVVDDTEAASNNTGKLPR